MAARLVPIGVGLMAVAGIGYVIGIAEAFRHRSAGWEETVLILSIAFGVFGALLTVSSLVVLIASRE